MPILGAIIAGGASRRFGSDKAIEQVRGQALIEHVSAALLSQVDELVTCGRNWPGMAPLDDRPAPDLGPLGGINAALHYAASKEFDGVLCMPVDVHPAPRYAAKLLVGERLAVLKEQHLIGYWPIELQKPLDTYLRDGQCKVHHFLEQMDARRVDDPPGLVNVNRRDDLRRLEF